MVPPAPGSDRACTDSPGTADATTLIIDGPLAGCPYTQIAVYFALERDGPLTARGLAAQLPRSRQAVNKALAALADENLIERLAGPDVQGQPRYRLADR